MYSFKDANDEQHEIRITFGTIFKVAEETGLDLLNPGQEVDGVVLSQKLLTEPQTVARVLAAICDVDDEDEFFNALDGAAYGEAETAFWNAYADFFARAGRDWLVAAIKKDLETKRLSEQNALAVIRDLPSANYSDSSVSLESQIGETAPFGSYPESPKPDSDMTQPDEPTSSAESTTRTSRADKTSGARRILTRTKAQKRAKKRNDS